MRFRHRRPAIAHQAQLDQLLGDLARLAAVEGARDFVHEQLGKPPAGAMEELPQALRGEALAQLRGELDRQLCRGQVRLALSRSRRR